MNKFCTNCGNELNGKDKCDKCGKSVEQNVNSVIKKVKNYDYKSKVEQLKEKASDIADKAKNYDYRGKAEDIKETVSNYDYKEKAKEISETIKSYDYIGEAENIKKGGFKYFWNKHKKLSTVAIAVVLVLIIMTKFTGGGITEKSNGYRCFSMTKTEFAQEYNDVYYKLSGSDMYNPSKYPRLDEERCKTYEPNSTDVEVYPNMKVLYEYDTTLYSAYGQGKNSVLDISTDENENIVTKLCEYFEIDGTQGVKRYQLQKLPPFVIQEALLSFDRGD